MSMLDPKVFAWHRNTAVANDPGSISAKWEGLCSGREQSFNGMRSSLIRHHAKVESWSRRRCAATFADLPNFRWLA